MTKIKWLNLSDIHLRHPKLTIEFQLNNLRTVVFTEANKELDLLSIAGDLFDTNLDFSDPAIIDCIIFLKELLDYCEVNNIVFRVLEGTPSHDHRQARIMSELISNTSTIDFKYVDTLSVEKHVGLGLTILYVPDECYPDCEQIQHYVNEALKNNSLSMVDIAIMHGQFEYQLPPVARSDLTLNSRFFLERVKYFIAIGHIHQHNVFDRIVPGGSFDRFCHGDEIPKGCVLFSLDTALGTKDFLFIENKNAKVFKTIRFPESVLTVEDSISYLSPILTELPPQSYVKLEAVYGSVIFRFFKEITDLFPTISFTRSTLEHKQLKVISQVHDVELVEMTKTTLSGILLNELIKAGHHPSFVQLAESVLMEVL